MYAVSAGASTDDEAGKGHGISSAARVKAALPLEPVGKLRIDSLFSSERWAPWGVLIVALFTRFYRLAEPHGVGW